MACALTQMWYAVLIMAIGRLRLKKYGYDFPPFRPPSESGSLLLRVTRGCTWNKCSFCSMYRNLPFERRPLDDVLSDISCARNLYRNETRTVFLGDSNSLVIKTEAMIRILSTLYEAFPAIDRVTSYARAKTLLKKPVNDLQRIRRSGLTRLHVGLETGNAPLLKQIKKGITPDELVEACLKVKDAGFELSLYILLGIGGDDGWEPHAEDTASVLSRIDPHFIRVRTLQPQPGSELYGRMMAGSFRKAAHETVLKEQEKILENLQVTSRYLSDHRTNYISVNGILPKDKTKMISLIREYLTVFEKDPVLKTVFSRKDRIRHL